MVGPVPEKALYALLTSGSPSLVAGRVFSLPLPDSWGSPCVSFFMVDEVASGELGGVAQNHFRARFQIDIWARRQDHETGGDTAEDRVRDLARSVRNLLDGASGSFGGVVVGSVRYQSSTDQFQNELGIVRRSLDFMVGYNDP